MMLKTLIYGKGRGARSAEFLENRAPIRTMPLHLRNKASLYCSGDHIYIACGQGKPIVFCHGLFGGIFNIDKAAYALSENYRFIMPFLPMYDLPLSKCRVKILGEYLEDFTAELRLENAVFIGSSMGGGAAAYFAANHPHKVKGLVLCGSSGLSNIPIARGFFKRKNYGFVMSATQDIFYNRNIPPVEMVDDVFMAIQNTELVIRSIRFTKSAVREKMHQELAGIKSKSLLIWGKQDPITPVEVAPLFNQLIPNSELHVINECGHVPSQEKPGEFLDILHPFLKKINY